MQNLNVEHLRKIQKAMRENKIEFVDGQAMLKGEEPPESPHTKLSSFIQNERNASIFYNYLSTIAPNTQSEKFLKDISARALERAEVLNGIFFEQTKTKSPVKESEINTSIRFSEGVSWAIQVENESLLEMINFLEESPDLGDRYKSFNGIIQKKIIDINFLHLL